MNLNEIERTLRQLRLSGIAATLNTCVLQAQSCQQPFLETLAALLQDELDQRRTRLTRRRLKHSRLDEQPSLADLDWRFNPKLPRQACFELHSLKSIAARANALLVGKPGTGKSHVTKAVAYCRGAVGASGAGRWHRWRREWRSSAPCPAWNSRRCTCHWHAPSPGPGRARSRG